jgi:hypothetical protein
MKWGLRIFLLLLLLFTLQVSVLAFPQPFFSHSKQVGNCTFYCDTEFDSELAAVMQDVNRRLEAVELHNPNKNPRVFLCNSQRLYSMFAWLTLLNPEVPGYNISLMGNSFVSMTRSDEIRINNGGFFKYCAMAGNLAHNIVHEIIHEYTVDAIGFTANYRLPVWKREGYAEYCSSIAVSRNDHNINLRERVRRLLDDTAWGIDDWGARDYYRTGLLVEYLSEIKGYRFGDIMHDSVTYERANIAMIEWYNGRRL